MVLFAETRALFSLSGLTEPRLMKSARHVSIAWTVMVSSLMASTRTRHVERLPLWVIPWMSEAILRKALA